MYKRQNSNAGRCYDCKPLMFHRSVSSEYLTVVTVRPYSFVESNSTRTLLSYAHIKIFLIEVSGNSFH